LIFPLAVYYLIFEGKKYASFSLLKRFRPCEEKQLEKLNIQKHVWFDSQPQGRRRILCKKATPLSLKTSEKICPYYYPYYYNFIVTRSPSHRVACTR